MVKKIGYCFVILILSSIFLALFHKQKLLPPLTKDEISGERLWKRITEEENFRRYPFWPGVKGVQRGQSPHGQYHRSYIHPYLYNSLPVANRVAPEGSIIIKENLDQNRDVLSYTVMAKVTGYNPDAGDWFWAAYSKDGAVMREGKIESCITCHSPVKDNDYIVLYRLDKPIE